MRYLDACVINQVEAGYSFFKESEMKKVFSILLALVFLGVSTNSFACGEHGGPGWRKADGKCASWADGKNPPKAKKHKHK